MEFYFKRFKCKNCLKFFKQIILHKTSGRKKFCDNCLLIKARINSLKSHNKAKNIKIKNSIYHSV